MRKIVTEEVAIKPQTPRDQWLGGASHFFGLIYMAAGGIKVLHQAGQVNAMQ